MPEANGPIPTYCVIAEKTISEALVRLETQMVAVVEGVRQAITQDHDHEMRLTRLEAKFDALDLGSFKDESRQERVELRRMFEALQGKLEAVTSSQKDRGDSLVKDLTEIKSEVSQVRADVDSLKDSRSGLQASWKTVTLIAAVGAWVLKFVFDAVKSLLPHIGQTSK